MGQGNDIPFRAPLARQERPPNSSSLIGTEDHWQSQAWTKQTPLGSQIEDLAFEVHHDHSREQPGQTSTCSKDSP